MNTLDKCQEWLADRVSWMQYPHIRAATGKPTGLRFKYRMAWQSRLLLLLVSAVTLILSVGFLLIFTTFIIAIFL